MTNRPESPKPQPETYVSENKHPSHTRRTALKKLLVGTGAAAGAVALPHKWAKPVVDRVLVPAHAQTSEDPAPTPECGTPGWVTPVTLIGIEPPDFLVTGLDNDGNWDGQQDLRIKNQTTNTINILTSYELCDGRTSSEEINLSPGGGRTWFKEGQLTTKSYTFTRLTQ